jgi:hypothetical protein
MLLLCFSFCHGFGRKTAFDDIHHDTPDPEVGLVFGHLKDGIVGIGRLQLDVSLGEMRVIVVFHRVFIIVECHDDIAVGGFERTVNDKQITIVDTRACHGVTIGAGVECGVGMADEVAVEIQRLHLVALCWRRETSFHSQGALQGQHLTELTGKERELTLMYVVVCIHHYQSHKKNRVSHDNRFPKNKLLKN